MDDGTRDIFRSLQPLHPRVEPKREQDMIQSYVRMYKQSGWMPALPSVAGERAVMICHHADEMTLGDPDGMRVELYVGPHTD